MSSKQKQGPHKHKQHQAQPTKSNQNHNSIAAGDKTGVTPEQESGRNNVNDISETVLPKHGPIKWFKHLDPIGQFTFIIAIFTVVLALTSVFQVWAYIQSEKPIVGITAIRLTEDIVATKAPTIIIEMSNKGKTTAFVQEVKLYGDAGMTVPKEAKPTTTSIKLPILPDDKAHVEWDIPQKIPQEYIAGVNKGEYHVWVVGVVRYADRFGWLGGGETGFCFYYDPSRGRGVDSFYRCHDPNYEYAD